MMAGRFYVICFFQGRRTPVEIRCCPTEIGAYLAQHDALIQGDGPDLPTAPANAKKNSPPPYWF